MYFSKSSLVVALFALSKIVAATSTPACLLSAIGPENPADLKALCKTNGDEIQSTIRDVCGNDAQDALKYYASTCKEGGYEISIKSASTSSLTSSKASASDSESSSSSGSTATATDSEETSSSDSDSDSNSGSDSGSSATTTDTPSSASSDKQVSAAAFAAVVFLGFAATL